MNEKYDNQAQPNSEPDLMGVGLNETEGSRESIYIQGIVENFQAPLTVQIGDFVASILENDYIFSVSVYKHGKNDYNISISGHTDEDEEEQDSWDNAPLEGGKEAPRE